MTLEQHLFLASIENDEPNDGGFHIIFHYSKTEYK